MITKIFGSLRKNSLLKPRHRRQLVSPTIGTLTPVWENGRAWGHNVAFMAWVLRLAILPASRGDSKANEARSSPGDRSGGGMHKPAYELGQRASLPAGRQARQARYG